MRLARLKAICLFLFLASTGFADITSVPTYPGGSSESVQTNKRGTFYGDNHFVYSTSTFRLTVPQITVTTITINGITYYFPTSQTGGTFLRTDGSGNLTWSVPSSFVTSTATALAIADGSVVISSPTSRMDFNASQFIISLTGSTTASIALDPSSATLMGRISATAPITMTGSNVGIDTGTFAMLGADNHFATTGNSTSGNVFMSTVTAGGSITSAVKIISTTSVVNIHPVALTLETYGSTGASGTGKAMTATATGATVNTGGEFSASGGTTNIGLTVTAGSTTIPSPAGLQVTYGSSVGSMTITGLSNTVLAVNSSGLIISTTVSGGSSGLPLAGGATNYVQVTSSLQSGASFYVVVGTVSTNLYVSTLTVHNSSLYGKVAAFDSAGVLVSTTITGGTGSGTPGGSTTQVQYNNAGSFAGTPLETVDASSISFNSISTVTYVGFSTMTFQAGTALDMSGTLLLSGSAGTVGQVVTSGGSGAAPTWGSGSSSVLLSSGIAFGSSANAVRSDTGAFVAGYATTSGSFQVFIGSNTFADPNYSIMGTPFTDGGLHVWNPNPSVDLVPFSVSARTVPYGGYYPFLSFIGDPADVIDGNIFQIFHESNNNVTFFNSQGTSSGAYIFKGISGTTFLTLGPTLNTSALAFKGNNGIASSSITVNGLSNTVLAVNAGGTIISTTGVSGPSLSSTNTWTATQLFVSSVSIGTTTLPSAKLELQQATDTNLSGIRLLNSGVTSSGREWMDSSGNFRIDNGNSATGNILLNSGGTGGAIVSSLTVTNTLAVASSSTLAYVAMSTFTASSATINGQLIANSVVDSILGDYTPVLEGHTNTAALRPAFSIYDQSGNEVSSLGSPTISNYSSTGFIVGTSGCTHASCTFSNNLATLNDLGITVSSTAYVRWSQNGTSNSPYSVGLRANQSSLSRLDVLASGSGPGPSLGNLGLNQGFMSGTITPTGTGAGLATSILSMTNTINLPYANQIGVSLMNLSPIVSTQSGTAMYGIYSEPFFTNNNAAGINTVGFYHLHYDTGTVANNDYGLYVDMSGITNTNAKKIAARFVGGYVQVDSSSTFAGDINISSGVLLNRSAGTSGQVLTSGGAGTIPTWTTPSGSGDVVTTATQTLSGIDTFSGKVIFSSGVYYSTTSLTGSSTLTSTMTYVYANCASACTLTLPTAVGISGLTFRIKDIGSGTVKVATNGGNIDNGTTASMIQIGSQLPSLDLQSDGANYWVF